MIRLKVQDHESIQTVKTLLQAEVSVARKGSSRLILSLQVGVPPCQQELRGWKGAAPFPLTGATLKKIPNLCFARSTVVVRDELAEGELPLPAHSRAAHSYSCNRRVRIFLLPENFNT